MDRRTAPGLEYHRQLVENTLKGRDRVYRWLRDRGLRNGTITKWNLGYVATPMKGHDQYRGLLVIPYKDAFGRERGIRFRSLKTGKGKKYLSLKGAEKHLFGVMYSSEPVVYITEGEIDTMVLHQMGFKAVGLPGVNIWLPSWKWLFRGAEEIVIVPDGDGSEPEAQGPGKPLKQATGGVLMRLTLSQALRGLPAHVRDVRLPPGEDVNSMYLKDRKRLRALLEGR